MTGPATSAGSNELDVDILVVGSGAAGFAAALTARLAGLKVLLVEKAPVFGGTSALSGGGVWAPGNLRHCIEAVEYLEANSLLVFEPNPTPDYRAESPGGIAGGRSLRAARFDGRVL
ncbi:FAD-dependent oxidoreductase [Mesorhizobium sp. ASY16-5R]|uniref:FAD-dependent oxidoreductase n=1 Tax=Mesorhizobium sp. ASY16-5R TaxID=3445772 RepID=UPI003F9F83EF